MSTKENVCPLADADRRLCDALSLWLQTKRNYFAPDTFRLSLNNLIQTLRNVTFILQKSRAHFPDFEQWYQSWQEMMREDPVMRWLVEARNVVVKRGELETRSTARVAVVQSWFDPPVFEVDIPPLTETEDFARIIAEAKPPELLFDIPLLRVERRWVDSLLPEKEILEALSHVFDVLNTLVFDAHKTLMHPTQASRCSWFRQMTPFEGRLPPCMLAQDMDRTVWMNMETGRVMKPQVHPVKRSEKQEAKAFRRYPNLPSLAKKLRTVQTIEEEAALWFQHARTVLARDGCHLPTVLLGYPDGRKRVVSLRARDRTEKHLIYRQLAADLEKTGATSLILITEAWMSKVDKGHPRRQPGDDPDRKEALQVIAADSKGNVITHQAMFSRDEKGRIRFENEWMSTDDTISFLEPIRKAWGIGK